MARPVKNPKSGVYYFRQKTPSDLVAVFGRKEVSLTLRNKDPAEAKLRNSDEVRKQALIWESYRKQPEPLPHKQIVALSGILYRDHMAAMELEPGPPGIWVETLNLLDCVAASNDPTAMNSWYGPTVDSLLLENGIRHAYIKRGTPQLNGKVERPHRSDGQEFYQLLNYKGDVDLEAN